MNSNDSKLDTALKNIGFQSAINKHTDFQLSDDPPSNTVLLPKKIIGPQRRFYSATSSFPFVKENYILEETEFLKWQIEKAKMYLSHIQKFRGMINDIAKANSLCLSNSSQFDQRRQCYYIFLSSLLQAPKETAFQKLGVLLKFKKLLTNRHFRTNNIDLEIPMKCCSYPGCAFTAIYGSDFCCWHILNDPNQKLFRKCKVCGCPQLIIGDSVCKGHQDST